MAISAWKAGKSGNESLRDTVVSECYRFGSCSPTAKLSAETLRQMLNIPMARKGKRRSPHKLRVLMSHPGHFLVSVTSYHERIQSAWRRLRPEWKIQRIVAPCATATPVSIEDHFRQAGGLGAQNPFESALPRSFPIVYRGGLPTLGKRR